MTRQTILQIWYNAYLEDDRETFTEAERILSEMDKGYSLEEIEGVG